MTMSQHPFVDHYPASPPTSLLFRSVEYPHETAVFHIVKLLKVRGSWDPSHPSAQFPIRRHLLTCNSEANPF